MISMEEQVTQAHSQHTDRPRLIYNKNIMSGTRIITFSFPDRSRSSTEKGTPQIGQHLATPHWDSDVADPLKQAPSPCVLPHRIWYSVTKCVHINISESPKLGSAEARPIGVGAWLSPENKPPPFMCYHIKFGSSASKGIWRNRRQSPKLRSAGAPPPLVRAWMTRQKYAPPPGVLSCRIQLFQVKGTSTVKQIRLKNLTLHVPPFKVIGTDTY